MTYDEWFETQPEEVKTLITEHTQGLMNTVKATREERDALSVELKSLAKKIDIDSEAGKQVGELQKRLTQAEKKSVFLELAVKQGVKRPTAAFAIANSQGLFLEDGSPDFDKIKQEVPELFTVQSIQSDAGSGTNHAPTGDPDKAVRSALEEGPVVVKLRR